MSYRDWTPQRVKMFCTLWNDGAHFRDIKAKCACSTRSVYDARAAFGLPERPRVIGPKARDYTKPKLPPKPAAVLPTLDRPGWPTLAQLRAGR